MFLTIFYCISNGLNSNVCGVVLMEIGWEEGGVVKIIRLEVDHQGVSTKTKIVMASIKVGGTSQRFRINQAQLLLIKS